MPDREIRTIKLSKCGLEVDIITFLTWGEMQDLQDVLVGSVILDNTGLKKIDKAAMREQKYKALEICIKEIRSGEEKIKFSREWMDSLPFDQGEELFKAVDEIGKKK
jgi:hypothetical protein